MSRAVVDHDIVTRISNEIEAIDALLKRLYADDTPSALEIDDVLERGFGRLMTLKAEARELRSGARLGEPVSDQTISELDICIEQLGGRLTELRVGRSPGRVSRIGYGFVLPNRRLDNPAASRDV